MYLTPWAFPLPVIAPHHHFFPQPPAYTVIRPAFTPRNDETSRKYRNKPRMLSTRQLPSNRGMGFGGPMVADLPER